MQRYAKRIGWSGPGNYRLARQLAEEMPVLVKMAHDSGSPEVVFHCPFCGSGQVIARNDGTIECEFCQACFTVQVQPQYPAFPQTINGMPVNVPGMGPQWPGEDDGGADQGQSPAQMGGQMPPGVDEEDADENAPEQPGGDEDNSTDESDDDNPFAKKSLLYRTAQGSFLDEDAYLKHIAFATTRDRNRLAAKVRSERTSNTSRVHSGGRHLRDTGQPKPTVGPQSPSGGSRANGGR